MKPFPQPDIGRCPPVRRIATPAIPLILAGATLLFASVPPAWAEPKEAFLPTSPENISTVPSNGDLNPYGVAFVPRDFNGAGGPLLPGDILVSNFNNSNNLQGTGTTIIRIPVDGSTVSTFFTTPGATLGGPGTGLTTALAVLRNGFVLVGSIPSSDGTTGTSNAGSLLVIDRTGHLSNTITDATINGPWDMTVIDNGNQVIAFVSNVFAGTVVRLDLQVTPTGVTLADKFVIASGYQHRPDSMAFVVGPTGLVYDSHGDTLFVAATVDNAVFALHDAARTKQNQGTGKAIYTDAAHLHGPLGMAQAPNGDLLVANADVINSDPNQPSEIVEFTENGKFVKELSADPAQGGSFGLAVELANQAPPPNHGQATKQSIATFAYVDDNVPSLFIWTIPP